MQRFDLLVACGQLCMILHAQRKLQVRIGMSHMSTGFESLGFSMLAGA